MSAQDDAIDLIAQLKKLSNLENVNGMARYGISSTNTLGVSMPAIRQLARRKKDHELALALWDTGIHEARILASLVDDPKKVTQDQMDEWTADFDSWDVCDQVCSNLYSKTPFAIEKSLIWVRSDREFVKRAGFSLMAYIAVHCKKVEDTVFLNFLEIIEASAGDSRNFVKKAINWALRQIGKRSPQLYYPALDCARRLAGSPDKTSHWVGSDAVKELESPSAFIRKRVGI